MHPRKVSARTADRLKDEVYRQMLRLESRHASADLWLAVAVLRAWLALEKQPSDCEARRWLRRLTPVCLRLIEEAAGPLAIP